MAWVYFLSRDKVLWLVVLVTVFPYHDSIYVQNDQGHPTMSSVKLRGKGKVVETRTNKSTTVMADVTTTTTHSAINNNFSTFNPQSNSSGHDDIMSLIETDDDSQKRVGGAFPGNDKPGSCQGRCGEERFAPCSCDVTCYVYKTCCQDVSDACPALEQTARRLMGDVLMDTADHTECDKTSGVFIVNKCPNNNTDDHQIASENTIAELEKSRFVYDNSTGLLFKNRQVYECYKHDSAFITPWEITIELDFGDVDLRNFSSIVSILRPEKARSSPPPGSFQGHTCKHYVINRCKEEFSYLDKDNMCGKFISYYGRNRLEMEFNNLVYGNRYCYYCNTNRTDGMHSPSGMRFVLRASYLSLLMDFTEDDGFTIALEKIQFPDWNKLSCKVPKSSKSSKDSSELCSIERCPFDYKMYKGKCTKPNIVNVVFGQPPKLFPTSVLLDLVKFLTCFIEKKTTFDGVNDDVLKFNYVHTVKSSPISHQFNKSVIPSRVYGNINSSALWFLEFQFYSFHINVGVRFKSSVSNALTYFFVTREYVHQIDSGWLLFKEFEEEYYNNTEQHSDYNGGDDISKRFMLGIVSYIASEYTIPEITPLSYKIDPSNVELLQICSDTGKENGVKSRLVMTSVVVLCALFSMFITRFMF